MPSVTVLYFAHLRERLQRDREVIDLPASADAVAIANAIARLHPTEAAVLARCRFAVDHAFVRGAVAIRSDAEVAVIPPVSGG